MLLAELDHDRAVRHTRALPYDTLSRSLKIGGTVDVVCCRFRENGTRRDHIGILTV